ncbi:MAG: relaxase/mobilization nuclease domain-containing protein [archaeon]
MPYVKSIPVRVTVGKCINYVLNSDKTQDLLYSSGINCIAEKDIAKNQYKAVHNQFVNNKSKGKKRNILAHHFIQSFKAGDVNPELAHKIANEWAEKVFGDNRQVIIATHLDKGHIHTHFVVNAYDFDGKKYYSNKNNLQKARNLSDDICKEYGIELIQGNKNKGVHYKEWMEKQKGTSWKHNIKLAIDKAVIKSKDLDHLLQILKEEKYEIKRGKYISIRPPEKERFVRTKTLGENYTVDRLKERIKNKDKELSIIDDYNKNQNHKKQNKSNSKPINNKYKGIQLEYVSMIKLISNLIIKDNKKPIKYNRKKPYSKENDYHINLLASQLRFLNKENITSEKDLNNKFNKLKDAHKKTKQSIDKLSSLTESLKGVISNFETYNELKNKKNLTASENLKLTMSKTIIEKYNIKNQADLNKLINKFNESNDKLNELKSEFKIYDQRYNQFKQTIDIRNQIKNEKFIKNIKDININKSKNYEL